MDAEVNQIIQAIYIATNPTTSDRLVYQQALDYLSGVLSKSSDTWKLGLALFVESDASGARKHPAQVRFWSLRLVEDFLDDRLNPLDEDSFRSLQQTLFNYIQTEYVYGPAEASQAFIRNKFSYVLSLFFICTYPEQNPSFFSDLFALISPQSSSSSTFNPHVSLLLFHLIIEISGEVADQILKAARPKFSAGRQARDTRVRDSVRHRDAARINEAVLTIVNESNERMKALRAGEVQPTIERELEVKEEIVEWGIQAFGSYIHWIDINLTVTPQTVQLLFSLLSDPSLAIRLATSKALLKMIQKGLKTPGDKLQLLRVLALGEVLTALEEKTRREKMERKAQNSTPDEGEESYRESLGRLLSALGQELIKLWEDHKADGEIRTGAEQLLEQVLPLMLRFMADEYDDTSSTVFPLLTSLLSAYKRQKKSNAEGFMTSEKSTFLKQVLDTTLAKMKWDEDAEPDDMDEDDLAAFDGLRKELRVFLDSIQTLDDALVTGTIHSVAIATLTAFSSVALTWQDVELAIHLVYLYGEIIKGSKGRAAFVELPGVIQKEKRKTTDYSDYPLTPHGEMMFALVSSGISTFPHITVLMQYLETVARYTDFFKVRKECVIPVIEALVDGRGVHHQKSNIRARASYLFNKFVKDDRNEVPVQIVERLLDSIRDVLVIQTDLPEPESPEHDILFDAVNEPSFFDSQLYLFEAAGTLVSLVYASPDQGAVLLRSVMKPVTDELEKALQTPMQGHQDVLPVLQVHHCIMALGAIAKGFVDFPNPIPPDWVLPPLDVFEQAAQAIIVSLDVMNRFKIVREAARSAFSRLLTSTGATMTKYIPALMSSLLVHFDSGELVEFVRFIGLLVHKLQDQILDVIDQLITPLSTHIFSVLAAPSETPSERQQHLETKKDYLNLLNAIISSNLHVILVSERNKVGFETILRAAVQIAQDFSDNNGQKLAFSLLSRTVTVWGQPGPPTTNGSVNKEGVSMQMPGLEQFVYEQIVPIAFKVPSSPQFNVKDGQMMVLCHEIGGMLQLICKTRGQEAYDYLVNVFLPSQNCPPELANDFVTKIRDYDSKTFKKFFTDFVRASRS